MGSVAIPRVSEACGNSTSALDLPIELISIIIESIRASEQDIKRHWEPHVRNLCLVHSLFLGPCREALFESVELRPPERRSGRVKQDGPPSSVRFDELIREQPQLAHYVRSVCYRLQHARIRDETEAALALERLTRVRSLDIWWHSEYPEGEYRLLDWGAQGSRSAGATQYRRLFNAFERIISSQGLRKLSIMNIKIPAEVISKANNLETLKLDGIAQCGLFTNNVPQILRRVSKLVFTGFSSHALGSTITPGRQYPIDLSKIKSLQMAFGNHEGEDKSRQVILAKTVNLNELLLKTSLAFEASFNRRIDPLRHLHPNTFTIMTHLLLDIVFAIDSPSDIMHHQGSMAGLIPQS
ncbi:hypothetical protein NMY22_g3188 [Coprinellus aureogranulatus]|nr:hypothetical protein NMY22_g3188 [Coprinellus aureogranulatus]